MIETWPCRWCGKAYREHAEQPGPNRPRCPCGGAKSHYKPMLPERAISLYAPWAHAILHYGKDVENRYQGFPRDTGWLWIHASLGPSGRRRFQDEIDFMLETAGATGHGLRHDTPEDEDFWAMRGKVLGIVKVTGHITAWSGTPSPWFVGPLGLKLGPRHELPDRVPCKGALGLWQVPTDVIEQLRAVVTGGGNP